MGRFVDLPKDVVWLILLRVFELGYCAKNWEIRYDDRPNGFSSDVARMLCSFALTSKNGLQLVKSKCVKRGTGWSFRKGAATTNSVCFYF